MQKNKSLFILISVMNPNFIYSGEILAIPITKAEQEISTLHKYILNLIKNRNFKELSKYVHPVKGIRFSPYTCVSNRDLIFNASQVANFGSDKTKYIWGIFDGSGFDIEYTPAEYFDDFVYDKDFINCGKVSYDMTQGKGNTVDNISKLSPNSFITVEYKYPGDAKSYFMDWANLRIVFQKYNNKWYLTGIIHEEWTI